MMVSDKIQYVPFQFGKKGISPFFSICFTQDRVLANLKVTLNQAILSLLLKKNQSFSQNFSYSHN